MPSIVGAMQSAAIRLIGRKPTAFFSGQGQFEQEISDLVNEVAKDCIASEEWQALIKVYDITGDGSTENFPFPDDYDRQLLNADVQDLADWAWGYEHIVDINEFIFRRARGFEPFPGAWIIYGNEFQFTPAPSPGNTASFPYVSKNYALDMNGVPKSSFTSDNDSFVLSDRLLTLGLVWRWREMKKLDYAGDQEAFAKCIEELMARDKGSQVIRRGRRWSGLNVSFAYPWSLG